MTEGGKKNTKATRGQEMMIFVQGEISMTFLFAVSRIFAERGVRRKGCDNLGGITFIPEEQNKKRS